MIVAQPSSAQQKVPTTEWTKVVAVARVLQFDFDDSRCSDSQTSGFDVRSGLVARIRIWTTTSSFSDRFRRRIASSPVSRNPDVSGSVRIRLTYGDSDWKKCGYGWRRVLRRRLDGPGSPSTGNSGCFQRSEAGKECSSLKIRSSSN